MTAAFNPKRITRSRVGVPPFGGKKILFLGDQSQLPPINGPAVYDERLEMSCSQGSKRESKQSQQTKSGQLMDAQPNIAWKLRDCFGKEYRIVPMAGSGFCGFHCLSYCLTGDSTKYSNVIEDCMTVFENISELFELRTNFASRGETATLASYQQYMRDAQRHVQFGLAIHTDAWCEDGHFAAISLLHDVAIFTYSLQTKQNSGTCSMSLPHVATFVC